MIDVKAIFEKYEDEFLHFADVKNKLSDRPDLHAFILLDRFVPSKKDILSAAEHDEVYLSVELDDLLISGITEDHIVDLIRCGIHFSSEYDCLCMFV